MGYRQKFRSLNIHVMKMLFDFSLSRDARRDVSIDMETEDEWEAISFNPNQPLIAQKVPLPLPHSSPPSLVVVPSLDSSHVLFVSTGDRWCVGMPTVAQGAQPVLLQAAD